MGLLEVVKGRGLSGREYNAGDYKVGHQMIIDTEPFSRKVIDYRVAENGDGKKYWEKVGQYDYVHDSKFFGEWVPCKNGEEHSDEELVAQTTQATIQTFGDFQRPLVEKDRGEFIKRFQSARLKETKDLS